MPYYFKINQHIEKSSGNKYLTVAPTNGSKGTIKMYEEMLTRIRDQKLITQRIMMKNI